MADDPGLLSSWLGIRVPAFFAGLSGGLVGAMFDDKASFRIWIIYAVGGALIANYLGKDIMVFAPSWLSELGFGFVLGVGSPVVVSTIKAIVARWRLPPTSGEDKP
jgi:hypothetical protein